MAIAPLRNSGSQLHSLTLPTNQSHPTYRALLQQRRHGHTLGHTLLRRERTRQSILWPRLHLRGCFRPHAQSTLPKEHAPDKSPGHQMIGMTRFPFWTGLWRSILRLSTKRDMTCRWTIENPQKRQPTSRCLVNFDLLELQLQVVG
jgi:hypothetical protein